MSSFEKQKPLSKDSVSKGRAFEQLAAQYFSEQGYDVLEQNWRAGSKEIDLIVRKNRVIVFVEVKSSSSEKFGHPAYRVDERKIANLTFAAQKYIDGHNVNGCDLRFDVVTFTNGKLEHYPSAFEASE